jgi:hypothetical protein
MRALPHSLDAFARKFMGITLRPYQLQAAQAVIDSVNQKAGRSIVILFSRQSGKDELSANLKSYLLWRMQLREAGIVEVNPTYKPQTINAMSRLESRLRGNALTAARWHKRSDFIRYVGRAQVTFLSGDAKANVVGAVASLLLIVNEAQDVEPAVYDRNFAPMAASTNATRLFMGTAWTSRTLLGRELRAARQAEQADGIRRVFTYDADDVRQSVPAYGAYVDEQIARLGRGHPLIRTQYFNEEIDAQAGMFTPARLALMRCDAARHPAAAASPDRRSSPEDDMSRQGDPGIAPSLSPPNAGSADSSPGPVTRKENMRREPYPPAYSLSETTPLPFRGGGGGGAMTYVFTLDVAGQDEAAFHSPGEQMLRNPGRDAVSLTIASVDLSEMNTLQAPIFRILRREQWTGLNHLTVFGRLTALIDRWAPQHIIIDATGVGEGLWALLDRRYPTRVVPVKFSAQKKSEIGYRYLAMIETGRLRDCSHDHVVARRAEHDEATPASSVTRAMVDRQYWACISEVLVGPQKLMRWGVPEGTRDENGELIHDDLLMADALLAEADQLEWRLHSPTRIVRPKDPLEEMSHFRPTD